MSRNKKYYMKRLKADLQTSSGVIPKGRKLTKTLLDRIDKDTHVIRASSVNPADRKAPVVPWPYDSEGNLIPEADPVNHPKHYTSHPAKIECIQITEHMGFCLGNAFKYLWRADLKNDAIEDLEKAMWYITREIQRRKKDAKSD